MRIIAPLLLATSLLGTLTAATIYDNGLPNDGGGYFSDPGASLFIGDDFTLGAAAVANGAVWWGGNYSSGTLGTDNFSISFFNIVAGVPGLSPFATYSVSPTVVADGVFAGFGNLQQYRYTASFAGLALAPGTYMVSITNDLVATGVDWIWAKNTTSDLGNDVYARTNSVAAWYHVNSDMAFRLAGDDETSAVPEPSTIVLGGAGLLILAFARGRRRTRSTR